MTMNKEDLKIRIARWALLLEVFDYDIDHGSDTRISYVDDLSGFLVMMISFLFKWKPYKKTMEKYALS